MASILNNVAALGASRQLAITSKGLQQTIERLTSGKRINRASDDAAGLAISNKLGANIRIASQGARNTGDGISYLQVADGALDEVTNLLTRAAELAEQAASGFNASNLTPLDAEFTAIKTAIDNIGTNTLFNGATIFISSNSFAVHAGDYGVVSVLVGSLSSTILGLTATSSLASNAGASAAIALVRSAIDTVSSTRGALGASQQQLKSVQNSLGIEVENFTTAFSQIRDANIADEIVNLTKFQILSQSGTSALSQANQASQGILALLR